MKKEFNFIRFDNIEEFETWLKNKKITRKINKLQVHHMYLPDYNTWKNVDKKVYGDNRELGRTKSLDDYGKNKWHFSEDRKSVV